MSVPVSVPVPVPVPVSVSVTVTVVVTAFRGGSSRPGARRTAGRCVQLASLGAKVAVKWGRVAGRWTKRRPPILRRVRCSSSIPSMT